MPSLADVLSGVHLLFLSAFVGGTSVAMLVAVLSRLRIPRTLCVWHHGPAFPLPLGPLVFLSGVGLAFASALAMNVPLPPHVLIGYPAGGLFWMVATWLLQSVVLTEYGIVTEIHRLHRAVAWSQIVDYFVTDREGEMCYVFFYRDHGQRTRFEMVVPDRHAEAVQTLVEAKLDARFTFQADAAPDELPFDR